MRVVVDLAKCQNHGQCAFAAPEVFHLDADGTLRFVPDPDESLWNAVDDAADVCPLQAIRVDG
jgi:ferredoxin